MGNSNRPYAVLLADEAVRAYSQVKAKDDLRHIDKVLDILDTVPEIGSPYDPVYEAARPPFEVRVAYAGHYGVYYRILEAARQVHVYFIEDQRRDPLSRFAESPARP